MELLTIEDVAGELKLSAYTVRKLLREKQLKGFKLGKEWRVRRDGLERFLASRQAEVDRQPAER